MNKIGRLWTTLEGFKLAPQGVFPYFEYKMAEWISQPNLERLIDVLFAVDEFQELLCINRKGPSNEYEYLKEKMG